MPFISCQEGNVTDVFITEAEIIDRFVGNQLWNWGCNNAGNLGINNTIERSSPVQTVSTTTNWKQASGTKAIKTDGTLWLWGTGTSGQLGNFNTINHSSPVQTVSTGTNWKQVSALGAIKTDGTLWMWGTNGSGQLGNNSTISQSSPVQTVSQGTNWKQISVRAAIKTDGTLWLWGDGTYGRLGNNSTINHSSPVQTVSTGTNWKQADIGGGNTAAIKTDGTLWLWGDGGSGVLPVFNIDRSSPVQVITGGTNWKKVKTDATGGNGMAAALKTDGTLWFWGTSAFGSFGNGINTGVMSVPVQTIAQGNNWKDFDISINQLAAAIKTDGTLWVWGVNNAGRLGTNNAVCYSSPVQTVSGGSSWKQVSLGSTMSAITFTEL